MEIALSGEEDEIKINKLNYFINQDENGETGRINFNKDRIKLNSFSINQNGLNYKADNFETVKLDDWWIIKSRSFGKRG